jgi:hypothetical protein
VSGKKEKKTAAAAAATAQEREGFVGKEIRRSPWEREG